MKIVLPWPDKRLTPNAKRRAHWSKYRGAALADRKLGYWSTFDQLTIVGIKSVRERLAGTDKLKLEIRFYPPDRRKRDDDGIIGAFKHLRDGICDALLVDDARLRPEYVIADPEKPGRVEITIG